MDNNANSTDTADLPGDYGGGVSARRVSMQHTRMLERAVREQWPVPEEMRAEIVKRQVAIATSDEASPRESTSAARTLVAMTGQNQAGAMKALDKVAPDKHEHTLAGPPVTLEQLHAEPDYVEYLEQIGTDSNTRCVCHDDQPGDRERMEDGEAP